MKANKKNISKDNFQRYLDNQMSDAERNSFERLLQKHPFEAEALEGFQQILPFDFEEDLKELSARMPTQKKNYTRYWAIAASLLLLISTGLIWYQLTNKLQIQELTESTKNRVRELETRPKETQPGELIVSNTEVKKQVGDPIKKSDSTITDGEPMSVPAMISEIKKEEAEQAEEATTSAEIKQVEFAKLEEPAVQETIVTESKITTTSSSEIRIRGLSMPRTKQNSGAVSGFLAARQEIGTNKIAFGKIVSLEDSLPLPGVSIVEKGTSNGTVSDEEGVFFLKLTNKSDSILIASFIGMESKEFVPKSDSIMLIGLESSKLALDEVVTVGYGVRKDSETTENTQNAQPQNGLNAFRKYLNKHAVLPQDEPKKKVTVKVKVHIDQQGNIGLIENVNSSEITIFEEAKILLLNGPKWNPKIINGIAVESQVSLSIVFKKDR